MHFTNFLGIQIVLFHQLVNSGFVTDCTYGIIEILPSNAPWATQIIDSQQFELSSKPLISYSIWYKYEPYLKITQLGSTKNIDQKSFDSIEPDTSTTTQKYFINSEVSATTGSMNLVHYVEFQVTDQAIIHYIRIQGQTNLSILDFTFDPKAYEGKWFLFTILYDIANNQIQVIFTSAITGVSNVKTINDKPVFPPMLSLSLGGQSSYYEAQTQVQLKQFIGKISELIYTDTINILPDLANFIDKCLPLETCAETNNYLIKGEQAFLGSQYYAYTSPSILNSKYVIAGWVKLNSLSTQSRDSTLLRITLYENYQDDQQIGDRVLYIKYIQSQVAASNGIIVQTYSYQYPISSQYITQSIDTQSYYASDLQIALTQWHFIYFEYGRSDVSPYFRAVFPQYSIDKTFTWSADVYHFTEPILYIMYGGDKYAQNNLSGSIANLQWIYCLNTDSEFLMKCHYSCLTCFGPNDSNCLTCSDTRQLQNNACICNDGYIDQDDSLQCIALSILFPSISEQITKFTCTQIGYEICDSSGIQCQIGYFQYDNNCVPCPEQQYQQSNIVLHCANCVLNPLTWGTNLVCVYNYQTYELNNVYTYQQQDRTYKNYYQVIKINDYYQTRLIFGFQNDYETQPGFYYIATQESGKCFQGCLRCDTDSYCTSCASGYALTFDNKCKKCPSNCENCQQDRTTYDIVCTTCAEKYMLSSGSCVACGYKCSACTEDRCLYCEDPTLYYVSFDGLNCRSCALENCKYCFEYFQLSETYYTRFDKQSIAGITASVINLNVGCSYCKNNKYISTSTFQCVDPVVISGPSPDSGSIDPISGAATTSSPPPTTDDACTQGLVRDNTNICLIDNDDPTAIQTQGRSIENCSQFIQNYQGSSPYCMKCSQGYYASTLLGTCLQCVTPCIVCEEQQINYQDSWKWEIRAFYKSVINSSGTHSYLDNATSDSQVDYELTCTECQQGYIIYKGSCITGCSLYCLDCQIVNGQAVCISCPPQLQQLTKTQRYGQCLQCPKYCNACSSRQELYNIYFDGDDYLSYQCYESDQYIDQFGFVSKCDDDSYCQKTFKMEFNVYCDQDEYNKRVNQAGTSAVFVRQNIYLQDMFTNSQLLESRGLYQYMNENNIRKVDMILTLYQGNSDQCLIGSFTTFSTYYRKNVYSVKEVNLIIQGSTQQTKLTIYDYFTLSNFQNIILQNLIIDTKNSDLFLPSTLKIQSQTEFNLKFTNIQLTSSDFMNERSYTNFYITVDNAKDISITNFSIINYYAFNLLSFIQLSSESINLLISEFTFINCTFINSSFFLFQSLTQSFTHQIITNTLVFYNVSLINTNFLETKHIGSFTVGTLEINKIEIYQLDLQNSTFIVTPSLTKCKFNNITISNSMLSDATLIQANIINIDTFTASNITLLESIFIANSEDYTENTDAVKKSEIATLQDVKFVDIYYNNKQCLIYLNQHTLTKFEITIDDLFLSNVVLNSTNQLQMSYELSSIFIKGNKLTLTKLQLNRAHGYPEFTLFIDTELLLENINATLLPEYFTPTINYYLSCIEQNSYLDQNFIFYIGDYKKLILNQLKFEKIISFDYPLIVAIGKPILQIEQEETIIITNSLFSQNMLIVTKSNVLHTIIYISSTQQTTLTISNCEFKYNHLHQYFQDISKDSSSTLIIKLEQGTINLENSVFYRNIVTNSTNSILSFSAQTIILQFCYFNQNNILNKALLAQNIFALDNYIFEEIEVQSYSGNGILTSHNVLINKTKVSESFSLTGGGFYIVAMGNGIITIDNSEFTNTFTSLKDTAQSMGGFLYIDGSKAQIQLTIQNSFISDAHSRLSGGAIMIDSSKTYNKIEIINCDIRNTFSLTAGLIMFQCSSLSTSELLLKNLIIENSESGFYQYLGYIEELQSSESLQLSMGSLIISSYCNVTIEDVKFQNNFLQYQMQFKDINSLSLRNIQIFNTTLFYAPILSVSPRSAHNVYFKINTIDIQNTTEIDTALIYTYTCSISDIDNGDTSCPTEIVAIQVPTESEDNIKFEDTLNCNKYSVFSISTQNINLLQLEDFQSTDRIYIYDITFKNNTCTKCSTGMLLLDVQQTPIIFKELLLDNNVCGNKGCISILNTPTKRLLIENQDYLQYVLSPKLVIQDGTFSENTGSALFIDKLDALVRDCIIRNNVANDYGGGIQYESSSTYLHIFESLISGNKAKYGPGIYLTNYQLPKLESLGVNLIDNVGTVEVSDAFEKPRSLALMFNRNILNKQTTTQNDSIIIEQVVVEPYNILGYSTKVNFIHVPTGQQVDSYQYFDPYQMSYISYNFTFRIILLNKYEEKQILFDNDSYCSLQAKAINPDTKEEVEYNQTFLNQDKIYFNHTSGDFNLDTLIVYFSPYAKEVLQLQVNCTPISIPIYETQPPYSFKGQVDEYKLLINLQTFKCQMGEYFNLEEQACVLCDIDQNQYSVSVDAIQCSVKNDIQMTSIKSSMIQLREGFWRPYLSSSVIEECHHLTSNCLGGWIPGDDSCTYGHIGALCEQCDLYNIQGNGSFSVSEKYSCGDCASITGNSLSITFVSLWTLISIMMSVTSTIETIQEFLIGLSLKPFKVTVILSSSSSAILIKMFTNYLQIISTIATFQLAVPPYLASAVNGVGNPIETMAYSLDCFLIQMSDINIIYLRIIWGLLLSFIYIIAFLSFYTLGIYFKKLVYNVSFITTTFIYIYIYLQPNLVGGLISLLSYRLISQIYWIQGNVAYRYDSTQHSTWLIGFVMPVLFVLAFLIPFFFFLGLYLNRFRLDRISTRKIWGYLYNEYKKTAYFWEIIKILLKEFMIIVLTYYEDYIPIKSSLIFLALFIYSWITTIQKPYMTSELNNLDSRSTVVCAVSIVFAATIYSAQKADLQEIVWPFYILIFIFNAYFIVHLLYKILYAYVIKLQQELDKVKIYLIKKYPSLKESRFSQYLETYADKKQRLSSRFAKVRKYLLAQAKSVLEFRKSQGFELPCRMLEESQNSSHSNSSNFQFGSLNRNTPQSEKAFTLRSATKVFPTVNNEKMHSNEDNILINSLTRLPLPKPIEYKIQDV